MRKLFVSDCNKLCPYVFKVPGKIFHDRFRRCCGTPQCCCIAGLCCGIDRLVKSILTAKHEVLRISVYKNGCAGQPHAIGGLLFVGIGVFLGSWYLPFLTATKLQVSPRLVGSKII